MNTPFVKSSFCAADACLEVAVTTHQVLVRDGKSRDAPLLRFTPAAWDAFIEGVASGQFGPQD